MGGSPGLSDQMVPPVGLKDTARRLRRWPAAILDPQPAAPSDQHIRPGRGNGLQPNQETDRTTACITPAQQLAQHRHRRTNKSRKLSPMCPV